MNSTNYKYIKKLLSVCCFLFVLTCSAQIINQPPTTSTPTICAGNSAAISIPGSQNGVYYGLVTLPITSTLTVGSPQMGTGGSMSFPTSTLTTTTTFAIIGVIPGTSTVQMTPSVTVAVKPNPPISVLPNDTICAGSSVTLIANAPGAISYSWTPATNLSTTAGSSVTATPNVNINYTVTATQGDGCISKTISHIVVATPPPTLTVAQNPISCNGLCNGSVSASAPGLNNIYFWSTPIGSSVIASSLTNQCAGTYTVKAYSSYCTSSAPITKTITITSPAQLMGTLSSVPSTCSSGNGIIIIDSISGGTPPYTYAVNGGASLSSNTITGLSAGTYTVSSTDMNGCMIKLTTTITQTGSNSLLIMVNSDSICAGATATLTASGATTYTWIPTTGLNTSLDSIIIASPVTTTIYTITGADSMNCKGIATSTVTVVYANSIFCSNSTNGVLQIHNAFSPNKDGLNDLFIIDNIEGFPNNHVYIFNRWGQLLWDKPKYDNSNVVWDGKSAEGAILYAGTYYYIIENVGAKKLKGWVEITSISK